ncbi:unnamed protein product, partial [marine sediment metagenome]
MLEDLTLRAGALVMAEAIDWGSFGKLFEPLPPSVRLVGINGTLGEVITADWVGTSPPSGRAPVASDEGWGNHWHVEALERGRRVREVEKERDAFGAQMALECEAKGRAQDALDVAATQLLQLAKKPAWWTELTAEEQD